MNLYCLSFEANDEDEIYNSLKNIKNYNVFKKADILKRLNYRENIRIGPIVMYGDVGYEMFRKGKENFDWKNWSKYAGKLRVFLRTLFSLGL